MRTDTKQRLANFRRLRVRKKISGTAARPRMSVCFTGRNIHVQFIDDDAGRTLAAASTVSKAARAEGAKLGANVATATRLGKAAGEAAKAVGITTVVFDRGSNRYHGKVKALADAAREAGLKF
jgi:large subunit ribosomal protein L18